MYIAKNQNKNHTYSLQNYKMENKKNGVLREGLKEKTNKQNYNKTEDYNKQKGD